MASARFILYCGPRAWRFAEAGEGGAFEEIATPGLTDGDAGQAAQARAAALRLALDARGYRGQGVVLALSSEQCLCASVSTVDLPGRARAQAMAYRLEEKLPLAAEDFVADFIEPDGSDATLGVCAARASLSPVLAALEAEGIAVQSIVPAAMLSLQHALGRPEGETLRGCDAVVWQNDFESTPIADSIGASGARQLETFLLHDGKPVAWYVLQGDAEDLSLHLGVAAAKLKRPLRLAAIDLDTAAAGALEHVGKSSVSEISSTRLSLRGAAAGLATMVLAGRIDAWIELRRGTMARGASDERRRTPMRVGVAAILLLLASASAAMFWRSLRYDAAASAQEEQQRQIFRQAMGNASPPANVLSRLRSEERLLRASAGGAGSGDGSDLPASRPLLLVLRDVLAILPPAEKARFRLEQIRLDEGHVSLEGQARGISDAQALTAALRQVHALRVEDPRTQQIGPQPGIVNEPAVGFTINATISPPDGAGAVVERGGP